MAETFHTVCSYCAVGCGMLLDVEDNRIVASRGDPDHPANQGRLCSKGSRLHETVESEGRLTVPMLRHDRSANFERTSLDEALQVSADHFARIIREHGPQAVAFYVSGQLTTEDYYVFNKLMKGFIGSNNIDSNSRLCMSSAVAGYKRAFGVDGPPTSYEDIDHAANIFLFGANPAVAHPILFRRIEAAKAERPGMKVIVIDPRRTDSCSLADLHLALKPGTDVALMLGMFNVLLWENQIDEAYIAAHTAGFEKACEAARAMTPRKAAQICGIDAADIVKAALWFAEGPSLSMYTMGFNQSIRGVDKNNALINLHLATGQIGKAGSGPFSLTGQPNAMGGRETGSLANLLPGHRDLAKPTDRSELGQLWNTTAIAEKPGLTAVELFRAIDKGDVKAVWIACTNPAVSMPDADAVRRALGKAEWVMVSDAYFPTDTTGFANVVLPAAGWAEKEGSMTNAERRISRLQRALVPPGEARPDWEIATRFARKLGRALGADWDAAFPFESAADVFAEHVTTTAGRDCDITGLSHALLDQQGPRQWPVRAGTAQGTTRLYTDGRFETPDGRANFIPITYQPVARPVSEEFPLVLTTGRIRDQWHTMTKTGLVPALNEHTPAPTVHMHPDDAAARGLAHGDLADVVSTLAALTLPVELTTDVRPGVIFVPMHWGRLTAPAGQVNDAVFDDIDAISKQPEFKHAPVQVKTSRIVTRGIGLIAGDHAQLARNLIVNQVFGSVAVVGSAHPITLIEWGTEKVLDAASAEPFDREIQRLCGESDSMQYSDRRKGVFKRLWLDGNQLRGVRWIGFDLPGLEWVKELLLAGGDVTEVRQLLLAPQATLPVSAKGPIVCACKNVGAKEIQNAVLGGAHTVDELKLRTQAGTNCGSCVPELKKMLSAAFVRV